ncbi:MAG: GNAT family N-acetyltransferase, partial [Pseudomonadota bacterium]
LLVGDEAYYGRFGFSRDEAAGIVFPPPTDPDRLLGRALRPGAFAGVAGEVAKWSEGAARP